MIMGDRMEKIKPCPFCGADPEVRDWMCGFCVSCENRECPCMPTSFVYDTKEEAINFWNRRRNSGVLFEKSSEEVGACA